MFPIFVNTNLKPLTLLPPSGQCEAAQAVVYCIIFIIYRTAKVKQNTRSDIYSHKYVFCYVIFRGNLTDPKSLLAIYVIANNTKKIIIIIILYNNEG